MGLTSLQHALKSDPYFFSLRSSFKRGFPGGASGEEPACQCRRPKRHRFDPWEDPQREGMATHSSILAQRIPMDHALEKEIATHSSVLAWRIPGTGEPGGLPSTGSHTTEAT